MTTALTPADDLDDLTRLDRLFETDPPPAPCPPPAPDAPPMAWALWYHAIGLRVSEDKPRSKDAVVGGGRCRTALAIESAFETTPDANVSLRPGLTRIAGVAVWVLDADGARACAWVKRQLRDAGILDTVPRIEREGGAGAKWIFRSDFAPESGRILVPGCRNRGHDGLEILSAGRRHGEGGKKASAPPSIHPSGVPYTWAVELPSDITQIPRCPRSILDLPRQATVMTDVALAEDLVVRTSAGRERTVAEWRAWMTQTGTDRVPACYTPAELRGGRTDARPSAFLALRDGRVMLHDSAAPATFWDGLRTRTTGPRADAPEGDRVTLPFGTVLDRHLDVDPRDKRRGRYLSARRLQAFFLADSIKCIAVRAPIGRGKTTLINTNLRALARHLGRPVRALSISHRRSLVGHAIRAYELRTDYRGVAKRGWREVPTGELESLGICLDSISGGRGGKLSSRLTDWSTGGPVSMMWDVVILDESESIFRHLHGATVGSDSPRIYHTLKALLRHHTRRVVLADAHLSDYSIGEYRRMTGSDGKDDVLIHDKTKRRHLDNPRLVRLAHAVDAERYHAQLLAAGQPHYVHVESKAEARRLALAAREAYPTLLFPVVTGDHADAEGENFLADPNGWVRANRGRIGAILFTRALESGVSITEVLTTSGVAAGDVVVVKSGGRFSTWQDLVQAVGRPRQARYIVAYAPDHGQGTWLDAENYALALREGRSYTDALIVGAGEDVADRVMIDAEHASSHVATVVHEHRSRRWVGRDWWRYWQGQGCEIIDLDDGDADERKAVRGAAKEQREALADADAGEMASADNEGMSKAAAEAILDRDATPDERTAAHKTLVEEFYERSADKTLIRWDDKGRGRRRIRALADVRLAATDKLRDVIRADARESGRTAGVRHRAMAAQIRWAILSRGAGLTVSDLDGSKSGPDLTALDDARLVALHGWLSDPATRRAMKLSLGIDPRRYLAGAKKKVEDAVEDAVEQDGDDIDLDAVFDDRWFEECSIGTTQRYRENQPSTVPNDDDDLSGIDSIDLNNIIPLNPVQRAARALAGHRLWSLIQTVARQVGLRLTTRQIRHGAARGTRVREIDVTARDHLLDLASGHWRRVTGTGQREPGQGLGVREAREIDRAIDELLDAA